MAGSKMRGGALNWRRLLSYLKPYWGQMSAAIIALLISMGFSLLFPVMIARLLDSITHTSSVSFLNRWILLLSGIFLGQAAFSFVQSYLMAVIGERMVYDLRTSLYSQLHNLSLDFFASHRVGDLVSRLSNDTAQMRTALTTNLASLLSQIASLVGAFIIVMVVNPRLTLLVFSVAPVLIVVARFFGQRIQKGSAEVQTKLASSAVAAEEALQGIRVVKSFVREQYETLRFAEASQATLGESIRLAIYRSLFAALMMFMGLTAIGAVIWYGSHEVITHRLSLAMLTGFLMYGLIIASNLTALTGLYGQFRSALGSVQRVFEIQDLEPSVPDLPQAAPMPIVRGHISFENVSFCYQENVPVIRGITLAIHAGEILALVGHSGAGKSTFLNLILRLYDPTGGGVFIDGIDLRSVKQSTVRAQIGIVPQEMILFGGTVRENILYGRLEASEAEIIAAAKAANAHEFIMELPEQYETVVGERGAKLSGGQRQRIAVARAILKDPRVLLLDEATSFLDSESEELVQEALNRVMEGRTTVIIAHRLSTIKTAHRIAVFDRGRIRELGSHDGLMKLNGSYANLYRTQFRDAVETYPEQGVRL
jgi:subfamily B ATP-binding cassette protein MsbA